jgi:transporter family-2 protein
MSRIVVALLPLLGGALIAAQAPVNARLRVALTSPVGSAFVSFAIGTAVLAVALLAVGEGGRLAALGQGPAWAYLGGAFGAVFVFATLVAAPRVGVTVTFVAVIVGQVAMSLLIDRFGWFGIRPIGLSWERVAAVALLAVSLVLLLRRN